CTRAVNDRRRPEPRDRLTDLRRVEQIDTLPGSKLRDFLRRRRLVRPADDTFAPAERLDDVAAGKTGGAWNENRTVHPSMFSVSLFVFTFRVRFQGSRFGVRFGVRCSLFRFGWCLLCVTPARGVVERPLNRTPKGEGVYRPYCA